MSHVRLLQIKFFCDRIKMPFLILLLACVLSDLAWHTGFQLAVMNAGSAENSDARWLLSTLMTPQTPEKRRGSWLRCKSGPATLMAIDRVRITPLKRASSFLSLLPFILTELNDPYTSDLKSFAVSRRSCRSKNALLRGKYCHAWKSAVHFAHQRFGCETDLLSTTLWLTGDCYSSQRHLRSARLIDV